MQDAWVQSLVRELRSHLPHDVVKIKRFFKKKKKISDRFYFNVFVPQGS